MADTENKKPPGKESDGEFNPGNMAGKKIGDGDRKGAEEGQSPSGNPSKGNPENGKSPIPDE